MSTPISYSLIEAQRASGIPQALLTRAIARGDLAASASPTGTIIAHETLHSYVKTLSRVGSAQDAESAAAEKARVEAAKYERGRQIALRALGKKS